MIVLTQWIISKLSRVMASLNIFPDKHVMSVFVLLYFVLIFCRHVSCVNVTRNIRDVFSYTGIFNNCSGFCQRKRSYLFTESPGVGKCSCQCDSNYRTFVTAELSCVKDKEIRNTGIWSSLRALAPKHMPLDFTFIFLCALNGDFLEVLHRNYYGIHRSVFCTLKPSFRCHAVLNSLETIRSEALPLIFYMKHVRHGRWLLHGMWNLPKTVECQWSASCANMNVILEVWSIAHSVLTEYQRFA
jgi:hypothetical protein